MTGSMATNEFGAPLTEQFVSSLHATSDRLDNLDCVAAASGIDTNCLGSGKVSAVTDNQVTPVNNEAASNNSSSGNSNGNSTIITNATATVINSLKSIEAMVLS
ncbi:hypothetical protein ColTof4_06240 [Colletotrichum tofieldiae]|nr:hypothetical protein ColTof3_01427 [Colletotrichum tofieldiae]GKT73817.1 hypothetical protein ColTof4_06240 [Colletotrichum tofieldiae]